VSERITGRCLCGGVRYQIEGPLPLARNCHCSICRRVSSAPMAAGAFALKERVHVTDAENLLKVYRFENRKDIVFCSRCGTTLFSGDWTNPNPQLPAIRILMGPLDGDPGVRPSEHIWVHSKAPWFEITDELPQYAESSSGERIR